MPTNQIGLVIFVYIFAFAISFGFVSNNDQISKSKAYKEAVKKSNELPRSPASSDEIN